MRILQFDAFTLDGSRPAVLRGGVELELRAQCFDVLHYLVEHPGRLVSKEELFQAVWRGAARTDDSLVQCIREIREALGEAGHRIIKTVRGRGYRFEAEVSEAAPASGARVRADASLADRRSEFAAASQLYGIGPLLIAAGLLFTLLATSGWLLWNSARPRSPATLTMMAAPSIVVQPVKPLGNDTDGAFASLADAIANELWRTPRGFNIDIRPSSAAKDGAEDAKKVGRALGVRYILQTSARRESDLVQINAKLIEADTNRQVWLGAFDYRSAEVGAQNRTAARIGRTLAVELLWAEVRRPLPARPEASHFTMLGRALVTKESNARTTSEAIAYFEKAIAADPAHYLALANYAFSLANSGLNGWLQADKRDEKIAKAEDAIKQALRLEPQSPGAHLAHGAVLRAKGDHEQAIAAFKHALLLNPNFAHAHAELGRALIDVGSFDEAIAEIEKAIAKSPTDLSLFIWNYWGGLAALHRGDHEGALDWLRRAYQANRQHDNTLRLMAVALADAGREAEGRAKISEFLKLRPTATLDDWNRPNARKNPVVAERRKHIRDTLKRLGVPDKEMQAAFKP